jgi:2-phosphosulfolactate phosphatase
MNTIEVCLSPKLFDNYSVENKIVVIVDILRATTIITTMFHNGLEKLIPVKSLDEAQELKKKGFLVAAERDGKKIDFADFDNSPFSFAKDKIQGKIIVYSTTNGTNTINLAKDSEKVIIASFLNLTAISNYLINQQKDVLILCSGWQGDYCTEDALFAGALIEKLNNAKFEINSDSSNLSLNLWKEAKNDLLNYIKNIHQYKRLVGLNLEDIIEYCFKQDISDVIPIFIDKYITKINKIAQA